MDLSILLSFGNLSSFAIFGISGTVNGFSMLHLFCLEILLASSVIDPDQMPCLEASDLGLHCLHMSPKMAIWSKKG